LLRGQRPVGGGHRAEYLGVQLNLVQRYAVVDAQVQVLSQRAHLHCRADSREPWLQARCNLIAPAWPIRVISRTIFWLPYPEPDGQFRRVSAEVQALGPGPAQAAPRCRAARATYLMAESANIARSSSVSSLTTRPGTPANRTPAGTTVPGRTTEPRSE